MSNKLTSKSAAVGTYWLRVRVKNSGKSVAKRCLGKISRVMDSKGKALHDFDPLLLHWVATDWSAVPFLTIDLNQDEYEYLDTLVTQYNDDKVHFCSDQFEWARYQQRGIKNFLEPGRYIIQISLYGDNVRPQTKYLGLKWEGKDYKDISLELYDSIKAAADRLR